MWYLLLPENRAKQAEVLSVRFPKEYGHISCSATSQCLHAHMHTREHDIWYIIYIYIYSFSYSCFIHNYYTIYFLIYRYMCYIFVYVYIYVCLICVCPHIVTDLHFGANITPKEVLSVCFCFFNKSTLRTWNLGGSYCLLQNFGKCGSK